MNSNEIYVSLDIGTSSVKVIIGEMVNDSFKYYWCRKCYHLKDYEKVQSLI